jgi:hypothetical protein
MSCFCQFCQEKGRKQGINVERQNKGFGTAEFLRSCRAGTRPVTAITSPTGEFCCDPEILAWEHFWHEGLRDMYKVILREGEVH